MVIKLLKCVFLIFLSASPIYSAYLPWPMFMNNPQRTGLFTPTNAERGTMDSARLFWMNGSISSLTSPAIGNIDTDDDIEIVVGGTDGKVYALKGADGSVKWSYNLGSSTYSSSPAIGDIDGDSAIEIVIGTQSGIVYSVKGDGSGIDWSTNINNELSSAPVIGNVDNDTNTIEVVVSYVDSTKCLKGSDGTLVWGAQTGAAGGMYIYSSPAIGNIDSNLTTTEVVVASNDSKVHALNGIDGTQIWEQITEPATVGSIPPQLLFTPTIKDIDNDGIIEVIVHHTYGIYSLVGLTGAQKWKNSGSGYGIVLTGIAVNEATAVGDIDGDSLSEVIIRFDAIRALEPITGSQAWNYVFSGEHTVGSNSIIADVDGDNKLEVIGVNHAGVVACLEGETGIEKWKWNQIGKDVHSTQAIGDIDGDGCIEIVGVSNYGPVYALRAECPQAIEEIRIIPQTFKVLQEKNKLTIIFNLLKNSNISINIFDLSGREKQKFILENLSTGQYKQIINTNNLDNGIYFIKLSIEGKTLSKKIVIIK